MFDHGQETWTKVHDSNKVMVEFSDGCRMRFTSPGCIVVLPAHTSYTLTADLGKACVELVDLTSTKHIYAASDLRVDLCPVGEITLAMRDLTHILKVDETIKFLRALSAAISNSKYVKAPIDKKMLN